MSNTHETPGLQGRVRGSLLAGWSENVARHWGREGLERVRRQLAARGVHPVGIVDAKAWYPVSLQIGITEVLVQECLDGDWSALPAILNADVRHKLGGAKIGVARLVGPNKIVTHAGALFRESYDVGQLQCTRLGRTARLLYTGAPLFENTTWRTIQECGWLTVFDICARPVKIIRSPDNAPFSLELTW